MPATVVLSDHAIARYVERVKPGLDLQAATEELNEILVQADWHDERPWWVEGREASAWLAISDCLVFPLCRDGKNIYVATTCLIKGGMDEERRAAKKRRKAELRARRAEKRRVHSLPRQARPRAA